MKPTALFIADLHLRENQPICRTDDFKQTVVNKVNFLREVCNKHDIPLIISGDIFHHWKPSPSLIRMAINNMPDFIAIPGQHDLPQHSIDLYPQSGLAVLEAAGVAIVLKNKEGESYRPAYDWGSLEFKDWEVVGYPYGIEPKPSSHTKTKRVVCLIHELVTYTTQPFPDAEAEKARGLLAKLKGYDLIVSGDNHQQFTFHHRGRSVINPGSVFRTDARQKKHQPKAYLWYGEDNSFEEICIPIDPKVVIQDHLKQKEDKDKRIGAYIEKMNQNYDIKLDFKKNLNTHMRKNKVERNIKRVVWEDCEGGVT